MKFHRYNRSSALVLDNFDETHFFVYCPWSLKVVIKICLEDVFAYLGTYLVPYQYTNIRWHLIRFGLDSSVFC